LIDPGCGVDIPAVLYSLSFAPYSKFSRLFPDQPEILSYLEGLAADFDINKQITYNVSLTKAEWQEKKSSWLLTLQRGPNSEFIKHECKVLILAVGRLVVPNSIDILGQEEFQGQIVHSAEWRPEICIRDKNVVVIGNGCE
jgi:cation diffusion facilitator CzcD-associated flavoprotein CzcO